MPDLIIAIFINTSNLSPKIREEMAAEIARNLKIKIDDPRIEYFVFPSDRDDVKAIPVKCYLEGNAPETPEDMELLVKELRSLISK